jgi:hypothetical protein
LHHWQSQGNHQKGERRGKWSNNPIDSHSGRNLSRYSKPSPMGF